MGNSFLQNISKIGRYVHIGMNVIAGISDLNYKNVLMSPVFAPYTKSMFCNFSKIESSPQWRADMKRKLAASLNVDKIEIGNDVFIGNNVIINQGVKIGDGAIVKNGTIVDKDVEAYTIVAGPGCEVMGTRFDETIKNELSDLKWWQYKPELMSELDYTNPKQFISDLKRRIQKNNLKYECDVFVFNPGNKQIKRIDVNGHTTLIYRGW